MPPPSDADSRSGSARAQRLAGREAAPSAIRPAGAKAVRAPSLPRAPPLPKASRRRAALTAAPEGADGEPVAVVPPVPPGFTEVELAPMVPHRAWVRILYDEADHTYLYEVIEPRLSPDEQTILAFLRDTLVRTLDGRSATKETDWANVLVEAIRQAVIDHSIRLSEAGARRVEYLLVRDFLGYGPIDVLMRDPMIEDISCDGPQIPIYLFHRKYESIKTTVRFKDEDELDSFVIRLAQRSRKHISVADPLLDATLPDGSRLQATLSREVTTRGSSFTVRKFRADPMTPPDLIRLGTLSAEMAAWFWFAMELGHSFILAGGTASGKTTSLNAISQFIPPEKKIVSIEDTREINLSHENWIAGVTRTGFGGELRSGKQAGSIDMYKLLEAALRQRPEYLLVGEVRGPEALTLFQAMATGHAVYSTMHADSVPSAVYRLENPPINVPRMMLQTLDIVAIQAQVRIGERMGRRIREVTEVVGFDPETRELLTNTVFEWDSASDVHRYLGKSYVLEQVMESRHMSEADVEKEWRNRVEVLQWMMASSVRHVTDVARVFSRYYRDPAGLLGGIRAAVPASQLTAAERPAPSDPQDLAVQPPAGPGQAAPLDGMAAGASVETPGDGSAEAAIAARRRKAAEAVKRPKGRRQDDGKGG
jgi:archaeal flagellar protein FlaI